MREFVKNEHGVEGVWSHCGTHFGKFVKEADGSERFKTALPLFVPRCCIECSNYDMGEYGDYGNLLSGPTCSENVWFPVRKGTCKKAAV